MKPSSLTKRAKARRFIYTGLPRHRNREQLIIGTGVRESGALNNVNDPMGRKRIAHAKSYYESVRKRDKKTEIEIMARNTNMTKAVISKVYDHIFINDHDLLGGRGRFDPDVTRRNRDKG